MVHYRALRFILMLCYDVMLCWVKICCAMLCYVCVMLCYDVTLCYVVIFLCYFVLSLVQFSLVGDRIPLYDSH